MKFSTIALIFQFAFAGTVLSAHIASAQNLDQQITLNLQGASLREALTSIEKQSDIRFIAQSALLQGQNKKVNLTASKITVRKAIGNLLDNTNLRYRLVEGHVVIETKPTPKPEPKPQRPGRISGKVLDDRGEPLIGASIRVVGNNSIATQSATDGSYSLSLKPGTYALEVSYISFQTQRITDIAVKDTENTPLNIAMKAETNTLSQVVVTSGYRKASVEGLYARQKNNAAVSDGITAEQISRTPDNNTAQVLARVSGLQVSDNKYVVVRGLSDRYNNVLLNGAMLPSSEPNRRNFAFDMVPSALLDRIVVNKTATPDLTGEFTGGLVQIETKDIPTENFFQLSIGSGYNTLSTGKDMIGLDRGKNAWAGFASDVHKKPTGMTFSEYSKIQQDVPSNAPADDPNRQKMHSFLSTMPENWTLKRYRAQPTQNYQLQLGRVMPFKNESRLGLIAALTYRNEQDIEERSLYSVYGHDFSGTDNKYATTLGGSLNLGYQFGKHKLAFQNTYNRKFSDNMWKYTGVDGDNSNMRHDSYSNVTVINQLFQSQLSGEHKLTESNIKLDWLAATGRTDRDQPYSRVMARLNGNDDNLPEDYLGYDLGDNRLKSGNLFYSELQEKMYNWAANVTVPFRLFNLPQSIKTGYQGKYRTADFGANLFRTKSFNPGNYGMGIPYEQVFKQENFGKDLYLHTIDGKGQSGAAMGDNVQGYNGFQRLNAFYLMGDLKPLERLRLIGGIRAEKNDQNIYDRFWTPDGWEKTLVNNKQTDWLPSANAIFAITDKINLRAAWYKTVARPDFREMSSFSYWDYDYFTTVTGSGLNTTRIENADLRLEYYPAPGEVISVSGFYKKFKDPIEMLNMPTSGSIMYQYYNLESALDKGFELDFRKSFNFISPTSAFLSNLYLSGNFTWVDASVEFKVSDAVDEDGNPVFPKRNRPLAGQSPYVLNGGLMYAGETFGVNLAYNRYGKRVIFASVSRALDEYENAREMLDLQLSYKFLKQRKAEIKLNISNLLNQEQFFYQNMFDVNNPIGGGPRSASVEPYQGDGTVKPEHLDPKGTSYNKNYDTVTRRYKFGTTYSLNFTYRF